MKKIFLPLILLVSLFTLTACNGNAAQTAAEPAAGTTAANGERQFTMPTETKLLLGTVKLDETEYAVDAAQASELLPLWKALRSLSESDTAAEVEIEAIITQLEASMTPEQTAAIDAMNLTLQDTAAVMETLGIETAGGFGNLGEMTPEMQATMEAARASGEFSGGGPGGDFPGGGMGPGGGQGPGGGGAEFDPAARATAMAERGGNRGAGFGMNSDLLDAIITFLEAKVQ